jgi:Flp pilus assembly pilin Flp
MRQLLENADGQDVAEYAIMLAVVLVIVMGMVRMIGLNANTVFSHGVTVLFA